VVAVAALAAAGGLAIVALGNHDNDGRSVAASATTSTARLGRGETTTSAVVIDPRASALPATTAAPVPRTTAAPPATAGATTVPSSCDSPAPGSDFDGFGAAEIVIENADGSHRSCVITADTPARQQQGLMRQDDLDGYDGMIFRFPSAEERSFWMRNTSIPLTIAFFDGGGAFVSATDMEPCGDSPDCPTYPSRGAAKFALEVIRGRIAEAGGTPGSRLVG
jgi:uncharacterized membrane protein (UPF0127 family)